MTYVPILKHLGIDAAKIVNDDHSRIVTEEDICVMVDSFVEHGYLPTASPITVRYATAPEICSFYQGPPHNYSAEHAEKLTATISSKPDFENHVYAYDGLIRKTAVLRLKKKRKLPRTLLLHAILVKAFGQRQAIAYGLAQNAVNGIAVKLSSVEVLLKCREYDILYNANRSSPANQTEVAKSMIAESLPPGTHEDTKKKQAETRRQVIGVARKLSDDAISYLRSSLRKNVLTARCAFTIANLRAIPKELTADQIKSLLSRIEKGYHMHLPKPKALDLSEVKEQARLVLEAHQHIESFKEFCGYDKLPGEMKELCDRMLSTQKYDGELKEQESITDLFPPLVDLCLKSVPGGALLMKELSRNVDHEENNKESEQCREDPVLSIITDGNTQDRSQNLQEIVEANAEAEESLATEEQGGKRNSSLEKRAGDIYCGMQLPSRWHIEKVGFLDFAKGDQWDELVSHSCDFATMTLGSTEIEDGIRKAVTHLGHALHSTGVGHICCTVAQYGTVQSVVKAAGLYMARDAMFYIYDHEKVKRLTFAGQTQPIHQCAAVFWREPPSSKEKHYFSADISCPRSLAPGWVSIISGLVPLGASVSPELGSTILRRWCKPGGLCYDATASEFGLAVSAHQLGIGYIGVEESEHDFQLGKKRLTELFSAMETLPNELPKLPIKRRLDWDEDFKSDEESLTSETPKKKLQNDDSRKGNRPDFSIDTTDEEDNVEYGDTNGCALRNTCMFLGKTKSQAIAAVVVLGCITYVTTEEGIHVPIRTMKHVKWSGHVPLGA